MKIKLIIVKAIMKYKKLMNKTQKKNHLKIFTSLEISKPT